MSDNNFNQKYKKIKIRPNCSPGFIYLNARNENNKYAAENASCLMTNCNPIPGGLIFRDLSYDPDYGLFHYLPQLELLEAAVPSNQDHRIEERIGIDCLQRPKYDIDGYVDAWALETVTECIRAKFSCIGIYDPEIVICDSSGIDNTTGIHKNSCHLIITNCLFKNAADACEMSELIQEQIIKTFTDAFGEEQGKKYAKCYDHAINNGAAHNLRMPLSSKNGRIKQVPAGYRREDLLITCGFQPNLPILEVRHRPKPEVAEHEFIAADTDRILALAADHIAGWSMRERRGNYINFNRSCEANPDCDICGHEHNKDNSLYILITTTGIWRGCYKMKDKSLPFAARFRLIAGNTTAGIMSSLHMIMDAPKLREDTAEIITADVDNVINEAGLHLHGHIFTERVGNYLNFTAIINSWCMLCQARHNSTDSARLLLTTRGAYYHCRHSEKELLVVAFNTIHDIVKRPPVAITIGNIPEQSEIYDEKYIRGFPREPSTLYIRANTGTGKTKAAMEYTTDDSALIISFRKAYTADKLSAYNIGRPDNDKFVSYLDITGPISLKKYPKLIIQAESLGRIKLKHAPDLLILDEVESIFDEFKSETMREARKCADSLEWLLKTAVRCLAIDANLGPRTFEHIRRVRGTCGELFIQNTYKSRTGDRVLITTDRATLTRRTLFAVERGENIVIPTNCKEYADDIHEQIMANFPQTKILKITSDMSDKTKTEIFTNVSNIWPQYQVVIYTPTCTAGISFELPHFAAAYCYFTNNSCTVQACCQMMARARDISSREYYVCIDNKHNAAARNCSLTDIRRSVQAASNMMTNDMKDFRALQHTRPRWVGDNYIPSKYDENLLFDMITHAIHIQNQTRTNMLQLFIDMWKSTGAEVIAIDEIDRLEAKLIRAETSVNKKKKQESNAEQILAATDVSSEEAKYLAEKSMKTESDNAVISRFWLREHYGYAGTINKKFIIDYNNDKTIRIFKNLRDIFRHNTVTDALTELKSRHMAGDKVIDSRYPRHYVAQELLRLIGYEDMLDKSSLTNAVLSGNIAVNYNEILGLNKYLLATFGASKKLFPQILGTNIRPILDIVNGIFTTTYGFSVVSTARRKNIREDYIIDHKYLGQFFATNKSDNIPFIIIHRDDGAT